MKRSCVVAWVSLLFATPFASALAQPDMGHKGFHAAVGVGAGSLKVTCNGCDDTRESGTGIMMRFGGAIRPGVVLSGEINGWSKEYADGTTATASSLNLVAQLYPNPTRGLYVRGGGGLGGLVFERGLDKIETLSASVLIGVGYDIGLGRTFSLAPYADYLYIAKGDETSNGTSLGSKASASLVHFGLAFAWR
jgi:hypothetical protein